MLEGTSARVDSCIQDLYEAIPTTSIFNTVSLESVSPRKAWLERSPSSSATMPSERELQISPIVPESVVHNTKALSNLHSLTASLFGVSAGVLGLESYYGFLVYIIFSCITALLFYALKVAPESLPKGHAPLDPSRYYRGLFEFWFGGIFNGISGFVLTWTLFYGLVRA